MNTSKNKFVDSHRAIMRKESHTLRNSIFNPTGNEGKVFDRGILQKIRYLSILLGLLDDHSDYPQ